MVPIYENVLYIIIYFSCKMAKTDCLINVMWSHLLWYIALYARCTWFAKIRLYIFRVYPLEVKRLMFLICCDSNFSIFMGLCVEK